MSDSGGQISEENNIKKPSKCRKKKRSDKQIRERNREAMRVMRSLKRELEGKNNAAQDQSKPASFYQMNKNEKNKTAMQIRREYNMEYRIKENHKNKLAMRLRRKAAEYRDRENQRNKEAMQMRRRREKEKDDDSEEGASAENIKVEMNIQ